MSLAEQPLQRWRRSWEEYLALSDDVRAEWVDGEVVVSPRPAAVHGLVVARLSASLVPALPGMHVLVATGLWLPGNVLRGPDLAVVQRLPSGTWVEDPPVLVVEVLSPSTRSEDTVRKSTEYAAGGIGQYWLVDVDGRSLEVLEGRDGGWSLLLHLDDADPRGEVTVGHYGAVPIDLQELLPPRG